MYTECPLPGLASRLRWLVIFLWSSLKTQRARGEVVESMFSFFSSPQTEVFNRAPTVQGPSWSCWSQVSTHTHTHAHSHKATRTPTHTVNPTAVLLCHTGGCCVIGWICSPARYRDSPLKFHFTSGSVNKPWDYSGCKSTFHHSCGSPPLSFLSLFFFFFLLLAIDFESLGLGEVFVQYLACLCIRPSSCVIRLSEW